MFFLFLEAIYNLPAELMAWLVDRFELESGREQERDLQFGYNYSLGWLGYTRLGLKGITMNYLYF
jgi:hypothetical protein